MKFDFEIGICSKIESTYMYSSVLVSKTVTLLPRHPDDANIVAVQLKRKLEMKTSHLSEYIRPKQLVNPNKPMPSA